MGGEAGVGCLIHHGCGRGSSPRLQRRTLVTSTREQRPGLAALLDYARQGDAIVVVGIDRLGRNAAEVMNTIERSNSPAAPSGDSEYARVSHPTRAQSVSNVDEPLCGGDLQCRSTAATKRSQLKIIRAQVHATPFRKRASNFGD